MKPAVDAKKVIAEWGEDDGCWLVLWPDGQVESYHRAVDLWRVVRQRDAREVRRLGSRANIVVTVIEWRNPPAGFEAPKA